MQKKSYAKRKPSLAKALVSLRKTSLSKKFNPYSAGLPHCFKRSMDEGVMYSSAVNTVSVLDSGLAGPPAWLSLSAVSTDAGGVTNTGQFGFSVTTFLSAVLNYAQFASLFQRYQIEKVEIKCELMVGESYNGVASALPTIYSAFDPNDSVAPNTLARIRGFESCQEHVLTLNKPHVRTFYPKAAQNVFVSALATGYASVPAGTWFDCAYPGVAFYGGKFYVRNFNVSGLNTGMGIRITPTVYMKFKEAFSG